MNAPAYVLTQPLDVADDSQHPAALTFHALNNAAQILRGDDVTPDEIARALELVEEGTFQASALYFASIRHERAASELKHSAIAQLREGVIV